MNVRIPKEFKDLTAAEQRRIDEFWRDKATECVERNCRIMVELYIKMSCVSLHDKLGLGEEELMLYLGHHKELFIEQSKLVRAEEQLEYLDRRMAEIFPTYGFPKQFFDKMLGEVKE